MLNASDFGVPQNRRKGVFLVALREPWFGAFSWPEPSGSPAPSVGQVLEPSTALHVTARSRWRRSVTIPITDSSSTRRRTAGLRRSYEHAGGFKVA
ncbi:hypothetical protein SALBM217S_01039 [Streptomyces griseoloalbus]